MPNLPQLQDLAAKWAPRWERADLYTFDRAAPRSRVFSIDSPPLTASGTLHLGHVFSYTQTDFLARFHRMRGRAVFYPVAFDDNGLPSEKRVQSYYGVRCDPTLPPDASADGMVGRREFLRLCGELISADEELFARTWRQLGLSVDWSLGYRTLDPSAQEISQREFLRNLQRGEAYRAAGPTLWDVTFQTAVAQAELEDHEIPGAYFRLHFSDGILVDTTRPELLPACVALVAHPSDERYRELFGRTVRTPLFEVPVPVCAHPLADPEKGTGIAMVCTFGDPTDIVWWRELDLPTRAVIGRDGRFLPDPPSGVDSALYEPFAGLYPEQARSRIAELLNVEPRPITHAVAFYERGERPLEIVSSPQWYIRNGGRDESLRAELLRLGESLDWNPPSMRKRFENWVNGLRGDWLISRQRYLGVPIPVWYSVDTGEMLLPEDDALPVDPAADCPPGYSPEQRNAPGGFTADPDVFDTWATSSLTPRIAAGPLLSQVYPMDLRPQAHEIIRTWLFDSLLRSYFDNGAAPWRHVAISGWVVDSEHRKMGKSAGNAESPTELLDRYGADAVRYWAAKARLGTDTTFDVAQVKVGRRLATKLLNATRFVLSFPESTAGSTERVDLSFLAALNDAVGATTAAFERFEHSRALEITENVFWRFCDDYLELVKERAYGGCDSARSTLRRAISVLIRLLAPFQPFAAEEAWSWFNEESVHAADWPVSEQVGDPAAFDAAGLVLAGIRRAKSAQQLAMRIPVDRLHIHGPADLLKAAAPVERDLRNAAHAAELEFTPAVGELTVAIG